MVGCKTSTPIQKVTVVTQPPLPPKLSISRTIAKTNVVSKPEFPYLKYWNWTTNPITIYHSYDMKNWSVYLIDSNFTAAPVMIKCTNQQEFFKLEK